VKTKIFCDIAELNLVEKFNINGFPHIQIVDQYNNKISEWSGPREVSAIVNWFKNTANL